MSSRDPERDNTDPCWTPKVIPVGTGYAIWTGIGAVGTATLGIILFSEPLTVWRAVCLLLIVGGVIGLKIAAS